MVSNDDSLVSDVQNIDTIDLDEYYIGCDNRISLSSTTIANMIKYWINVQNDLIVQRYLSLLGSAAIGDVSIEYNPTDVIKYGSAVNGAPDTYKNILKTILDSQFDYTENNASINGWIIDYLLNPNDLFTNNPITGKEEACDDNLTTEYHDTVSGTGAANTWFYKDIYNLDLGEIKTISDIHTMMKRAANNVYFNYSAVVQSSENGADWTTRITLASSSSTQFFNFTNSFDARYIRVYIGCSRTAAAGFGASSHTVYIYDISVFT